LELNDDIFFLFWFHFKEFSVWWNSLINDFLVVVISCWRISWLLKFINHRFPDGLSSSMKEFPDNYNSFKLDIQAGFVESFPRCKPSNECFPQICKYSSMMNVLCCCRRGESCFPWTPLVAKYKSSPLSSSWGRMQDTQYWQ